MLTISMVRRVFLAQYKVNLQKMHDVLLADVYKLGLHLWVGYKKFTNVKMITKLHFLTDVSTKEILLSELQLF